MTEQYTHMIVVQPDRDEPALGICAKFFAASDERAGKIARAYVKGYLVDRKGHAKGFRREDFHLRKIEG